MPGLIAPPLGALSPIDAAEENVVWIRTIDEAEATGVVKEIYERSPCRFGTSEVTDMVKVFSLKPSVLEAVERFRTAVTGATGLSPARKQMIAVVVAALTHCTY